MIIDVIIPAHNEESSIAFVVNDIPKSVREIIVVDNDSKDDTSKKALEAGAKVLKEGEKGYGAACLKAIDYISTKGQQPDVVVFLDGDYSDYPQEMSQLLLPIQEGFDMVIGSRSLRNREKGAMLPQQLFGNWLACTMIKFLFGWKYSDLGPFRAIKWTALKELEMVDRNFGWTVEMQVKAIKKKLRVAEVPVSYRKRIGVSKVTGTVKGTILAGYKIIYTILKYR